MNRTLLFGIMSFLALVGVSLLGGEKKAVAGHGCCGCYGYSAGYVSGGCWGPRYPVRRSLFRPWRNSYYYPAVSYGCGGCSGCFGGCSGCYGGWDCYGGRVVIRRPVTPAPEASPALPQPAPAPSPDEASVSRDAMFLVRVAPDVKLFVNDRATSSPGRERRYVSNGLEPGKTYRYELRAEAVRHGEKVSQTKVVTLEVGGSVELAFDFDDARVAQASVR